MDTNNQELKDTQIKPFTITCNNCGSNNVTAKAYDYYDLGIICHDCKAFLNCGSYNEAKYTEDQRWENTSLRKKI